MQRLSQEEGVNLAGIKRVIELEHHVEALRGRLVELAGELSAARDALLAAQASSTPRRDLVPLRDGALVVWRPSRR